MNLYSLVVASATAATVFVFGVVAVRIHRRLPRNALLACLASFSVSHAVTIGLLEGTAPAPWRGLSFGASVLGYASLALFALLFLHGGRLRRHVWTAIAVLAPGAAIAAGGAATGWSASEAFRPATDALSVAVNGYLILCLGVVVAESLAVWRRFPARAREAFPIVAGSIALIVGGPIYAFELGALGFPALGGTNLAVPIAGGLFAAAMASGNSVPFRGRTMEGERRVPWEVPSGAYLVEETRPKYAQALFLAAAPSAPALAVVSEPASSVPDLAGVETVRLPPGPQCAAVLEATVSEFLSRRRGGVVLVNDVSYAVANSGLPATVDAVERAARAAEGSGRVIFALTNLTPDERAAFAGVRATRVPAPDVEAEIAAILRTHLGAHADQLTRAAAARGRRVEDLSLLDLPHVRDSVLGAVGDLRGSMDAALGAGWHRAAEGLARDFDTLWRTPPMEARARAPPTAEAPEFAVVRAEEILGRDEAELPVTRVAPEPPAEAPPLGPAVREAFMKSLGPAGEPVYRRVMMVLRRDAATLTVDDLPRVSKLAGEALAELGGVIDVADAKRDLVERSRRLHAQLAVLGRSES